MYERKLYQDQLARFAGTPVIKVLTGMRRVGKSTVMRMFREQLAAGGASPEQLVFVDMELLEFASIKNAADLHAFVTEKRQKGKSSRKPQYLFIDEVQEIEDWEKAINSILNEGGFDIYLTGSNANLLSGELATLLTGRYVEIPVYPLSFGEYAFFRNALPDEGLFDEYMRRGGMPGIHHMDQDDETIRQYLGSLADSIILKDIVGRYAVRDVDLLRRIIRFIADNSGNVFSAKRIADFMRNERRTVGVETVYNYLSYMMTAFLAYQVPRYDMKGKRFLEVGEKYYFSDLGLKNALIGYRQSDINAALETVVYFELKRRGFTVSVGKVGNAEIDFIAERSGQKMYVQVCYLLADQSVEEREFGALESVSDNYPKYVLSMDRIMGSDRNGIKRVYLPDFLMENSPELQP
jgi:predicted AAA+ superfamily ATPase